jgi:2-alkyl-3-oxoalkanoate reductase
MMRALVTGANGFLGSHIASQLVRDGHSVRLLLRRSPAQVPAGCDIALGDLSDADSLQRSTQGIDVVFHCAALVSDWGPLASFQEVNRDGVRRLLEASAAAGVRRFVHVSTIDVLGWRGHVLREDDQPVHTGFAYPDTKGEGETLVKQLAPALKIEHAIIRPGWIYGPGDRVFVPEIVDALRKKGALVISKGRLPAPLVFVGNAVPAIVRAGLVQESAGKTFHLVDQPMPTWAEFMGRIAKILGTSPPTLSLSPAVAYACAALMESWARIIGGKTRPLLTRYLVRYWSAHFDVETARAAEMLGFRTTVSLDEGLQLALNPAGKLAAAAAG